MLISFISIFNKTRNIYRIKVYKKVFFFFIQEIAAPEIVRIIVFIAFDVIDGEFLTLSLILKTEITRNLKYRLPSLQKSLHVN